MTENGNDLVDRMHREACDRHRQEEERGRQMMDEAHRKAVQQYRTEPAESAEPPTIHYTELQDLPEDSAIYEEWKTYRGELPRLLKEGLEGQFALIKGGQIMGIFPTLDEGLQAGRLKYLMQPFLVQPIREREPLLRIRGHSLPCRCSIIRSPRLS